MSNSFRLTAATGLHKGDRQYQQDQVAILQHPRDQECILAVIADGMGGRSGGRKAADQVMLTAQQLLERFDPQTDNPGLLLQNIVKEAHLIIRLTAISAEQEPHSTIAAFLITPQGQCHCVHAGDSRFYHYQAGRLVFRTKDHSYVQSLVDSGEITEDEALGHPNSNMLIGCLGSEIDPPAPVRSVMKLEVGDAFVACSDGLWAYFSPTELGQTVDMLSAREAAMFLISKARERSHGMGDNLSIVIFKLEPLIEQKNAKLSDPVLSVNPGLAV